MPIRKKDRQTNVYAAHKDLEFHVPQGSGTHVHKKFENACADAVAKGFFHGNTHIDIVVHSKAAAKAWAGDVGVEQYEEDPDASVFDRIEIKVNDLGSVP